MTPEKKYKIIAEFDVRIGMEADTATEAKQNLKEIMEEILGRKPGRVGLGLTDGKKGIYDYELL